LIDINQHLIIVLINGSQLPNKAENFIINRVTSPQPKPFEVLECLQKTGESLTKETGNGITDSFD
jgi:hypothetical protein